MLTTPLAFWTVERFGRRSILLIGASCMITFQFIVGIIGVTAGEADKHNTSAVSAMIACEYLPAHISQECILHSIIIYTSN